MSTLCRSVAIPAARCRESMAETMPRRQVRGWMEENDLRKDLRKAPLARLSDRSATSDKEL